ncbi:hypothetical protein AVEN_19059-1 [Araneus ventricosus]|uniref:Uncharacterized protein n=1 Tax=Araneus ventricosus TaxID=182803 RepID=A0A4Y2VEX6_ARAVE|nr:hypothetical protein AVEN_19059-1 [Araneus ventricosus]
MTDSNSDVEFLHEDFESDIQERTSAPLPQDLGEAIEPNFDNLQINEEISELVVFPALRRRRSSSTSSVSSIISSSQGLATKIFDDKTPLEDLLSSLRKIVNSTTSPTNAKTKPKPRLTVTLQQFANSILDRLEERRDAFADSKESDKSTGTAISPQLPSQKVLRKQNNLKPMFKAKRSRPTRCARNKVRTTHQQQA